MLKQNIEVINQMKRIKEVVVDLSKTFPEVAVGEERSQKT